MKFNFSLNLYLSVLLYQSISVNIAKMSLVAYQAHFFL
nr:MAG TPA: hypothetical protein [Caudoviricetes sp.]